MKLEEFDNTAFGAGMQFKYRGETYNLVQVCFQEKLLGLFHAASDEDPDGDTIVWVRCENAELLPCAT